MTNSADKAACCCTDVDHAAAEGCTSTLADGTTTASGDTNNCVLTRAVADDPATTGVDETSVGSCADVDSAVATCAYEANAVLTCEDHLTSRVSACAPGYFKRAGITDVEGGVVMSSTYAGADGQVRSIEYTGPPTNLSWELQHSLCAAAGRATPGSDLTTDRTDFSDRQTELQTEFCAYSPTDNHVVADDCGWHTQDFTYVSGTLGGGVGYMCSSNSDCTTAVRIQGGSEATADPSDYISGTTITLNSGDSVFCSRDMVAGVVPTSDTCIPLTRAAVRL